MNSSIATVFHFFENSDFTTLFLDALLKSFVVLALAGVCCFLLRRVPAAARHWIWFLAVASLPLLPLFSSLLPSWQKPLWSVSTGFDSGNQFSLSLELAPVRQQGISTHETQIAPVAEETSSVGHVPSRASRGVAARFSTLWVVIAFTVWLGGVAAILSSIIVGQLRLRMISKQSRPLQSDDWKLLLRETCEKLGTYRAMILLQSADRVMPLTWGWLRPVILFPAGAERWPLERLRIVLLHELAHVKRWDCLTQMITQIVCAFYWYNPLVWLAARKMRVEREQAADDLVLNSGCKASEYASQLVEIVRGFQRAPQVAAIAMAHTAKLEGRIKVILDATRKRSPLGAFLLSCYCFVALGLAAAIAAQKPEAPRRPTEESRALHEKQLARLRDFSKAKEKQSLALAAKAAEQISPEFRRFFDAAIQGDGQTVTNMFESFKRRHPQYEGSRGVTPDESLRTSYWPPILEIALVYYDVMAQEPKYVQIAVDGIVSSIPLGSIYFGGTDPGRGLPTAFCKSHVEADPFFTLTQNALADGSYLQYLRDTYGGRIYVPTVEEAHNCFQNYLQEAGRRLKENKLKPGEHVIEVDGKLEVSGQVVVMAINGLLTKLIFDKNPDRDFYVEESFPLDWMYPHLEPHGMILKINRQPLNGLSEEMVREDRKYWSDLVADMIGDWLRVETPLAAVCEFAENTHLRGDMRGFKGDPRFIRNNDSKKFFSKSRSSIAAVYAWRAQRATDAADKARLTSEADFALRQAWALCPYSPEACFRYAQLLVSEKRYADALSVAETTARLPIMQGEYGEQVRGLVKNLKEYQSK